MEFSGTVSPPHLQAVGIHNIECHFNIDLSLNHLRGLDMYLYNVKASDGRGSTQKKLINTRPEIPDHDSVITPGTGQLVITLRSPLN